MKLRYTGTRRHAHYDGWEDYLVPGSVYDSIDLGPLAKDLDFEPADSPPAKGEAASLAEPPRDKAMKSSKPKRGRTSKPKSE